MTKPHARRNALAACLLAGCAPLLAGAALAERLEKCPVDSAKQADVAAAVKAAPSCAQSYEVLNACRTGGGGDVALSAIVIEACDKVFSPTLDAAASRAYKAALDSCAKRFAHQDGAQSASFEAVCEAGVAVVFAHRADLAAMRAQRAPYGNLAPVNQH